VVYTDYHRFLAVWLEPLVAAFRATRPQAEANTEHKVRKEVGDELA
jgi:hypothetical protein